MTQSTYDSKIRAQRGSAVEGRDDVEARDDDDESPARGAQPGFGTSFIADGTTDAAWQRWRELQSDFVDDPRSAVAEASGLVSELIDGIVRGFESEREALERRWSSGQEVSTEDLRCALQRYRDFFGRLLANASELKADAHRSER